VEFNLNPKSQALPEENKGDTVSFRRTAESKSEQDTTVSFKQPSLVPSALASTSGQV
jgi:hypothetical protein